MLYFAYGADLHPAQMTDRSPGHRSVGVVRLPNHRLIFPRFSREWGGAVASLSQSPSDVVFGALYDLPPDEVPVMHHHKGYDPDGPPELNEHVFREVTVRRLAGAEQISAWTYLAVPDNTAVLPSRAYVDTLVDGARYHGLPRAYLVLLNATRAA
jgi:hypothetical protein